MRRIFLTKKIIGQDFYNIPINTRASMSSQKVHSPLLKGEKDIKDHISPKKHLKSKRIEQRHKKQTSKQLPAPNSLLFHGKSKFHSIKSPKKSSNREKTARRGYLISEAFKSNNNTEAKKTESTSYFAYQTSKTSKNKSKDSDWIHKNRFGSLAEDHVFNEYGYSNISYAKLSSQRSTGKFSDIKYRKVTEKEIIDNLMKKYTQKSRDSSKNNKFTTLSTDDKSEKKANLKKPKRNRKNIVVNKNRFLSQGQKEIPIKVKSLKKRSPSLLPEYFGCLEINKIESKIQTTFREDTTIKRSKSKSKGQPKNANKKSQPKIKDFIKKKNNQKVSPKKHGNIKKLLSKEKFNETNNQTTIPKLGSKKRARDGQGKSTKSFFNLERVLTSS